MEISTNLLQVKESTKISEVSWAEINKLKSVGFTRGAKLIEKNLEQSRQAPNADVGSMFRVLMAIKKNGKYAEIENKHMSAFK